MQLIPIPILVKPGVRTFVNDWNAPGPARHCGAGAGHVAEKIDKLGKLLALEVAIVC